MVNSGRLEMGIGALDSSRRDKLKFLRKRGLECK